MTDEPITTKEQLDRIAIERDRMAEERLRCMAEERLRCTAKIRYLGGKWHQCERPAGHDGYHSRSWLPGDWTKS